jgi:hypothetical protein
MTTPELPASEELRNSSPRTHSEKKTSEGPS